MAHFAKGSAQAHAFMARLRAMRRGGHRGVRKMVGMGHHRRHHRRHRR